MFNLNDLAQACHRDARERGFWSEPQDPARMLMLVVSELAEALEDIRNGRGLNEPLWEYISTPGCYSPKATVTGEGTFVWYGSPAEHKVVHEDYVAWGWLCKPVGVPSEMADALIRILDICAAWGIDIEEAVRLKREYNATRGHMNGGKKF